MKKIFTSVLLLFILTAAGAQTETIAPEKTAGIYYAYPVTTAQRLPIPDGFEIFYIAHYGRHGSRWVTSEDRYTWVNSHFADKKQLTKQGRRVRKQLKKVWNNARGHAGQLTPLGAEQHRQIARRMATCYPEAFAEGATVTAESSVVGRCRASMLAFCSALSEQFPSLSIAPKTDSAAMAYLNHESEELRQFNKMVKRQPKAETDGFIGNLFKDVKSVKSPIQLLSELHTIAADMQDIPLDVNLWHAFTPEEMLAVYQANNERMTLSNGLAPENHGIPARSSLPLWQEIVTKADAMIASGGHGASLRFGHDTALYRLLTLLQLTLPGPGMDQIVPMAANLQMIFIRNDKGEVRVAFLHNERLQHLPIALSDTFYRWDDVKRFISSSVASAEPTPLR